MAKRKSGWGICGSFLVVVLVVWFVSRDDLPEIFGPHESCTLLLFTAYAIVRTVPSANRPNQRKKKVKTIHCQRKRRKKHPASNVAAESAPHPRHAAKACDNNTETIPNNMVLWQRWATCKRGQRPSISNGVPRDPAILLDLQKHCGLLKPC